MRRSTPRAPGGLLLNRKPERRRPGRVRRRGNGSERSSRGGRIDWPERLKRLCGSGMMREWSCSREEQEKPAIPGGRELLVAGSRLQGRPLPLRASSLRLSLRWVGAGNAVRTPLRIAVAHVGLAYARPAGPREKAGVLSVARPILGLHLLLQQSQTARQAQFPPPG